MPEKKVLVSVVVKTSVPGDESDSNENLFLKANNVINEADYSFTYNDGESSILDTEIVDIENLDP